jgi:hypothetical protein
MGDFHDPHDIRGCPRIEDTSSSKFRGITQIETACRQSAKPIFGKARAFNNTQERTGRLKLLGIALLRKENKSRVNEIKNVAARKEYLVKSNFQRAPSDIALALTWVANDSTHVEAPSISRKENPAADNKSGAVVRQTHEGQCVYVISG